MKFFSNIFDGDLYDDEEDESYWLKSEAIKNVSEKANLGIQCLIWDLFKRKKNMSDDEMDGISKEN